METILSRFVLAAVKNTEGLAGLEWIAWELENRFFSFHLQIDGSR